MDLKDIEEDLPILLSYYEEVVRKLESNAVATRRMVPRKDALDMFLRTRNYREVAERFDVTPSSIRDIVRRAIKAAREIAAGR